MKQKIEHFFLKVQEKITLGLLFIIYFLVLGPTAIYFKLVRHKSLPKEEIKGDSSWVDTPAPSASPDNYLKQY